MRWQSSVLIAVALLTMLDTIVWYWSPKWWVTAEDGPSEKIAEMLFLCSDKMLTLSWLLLAIALFLWLTSI